MNKRASINEGVFMIIRMVLVVMIFFVVFGLSSIYYEYYINVRDIEAGILARNVVNCVAPNGEINLDKIPADKDILNFCGIKVNGYIYLGIQKGSGDNLVMLRQIQGGNSGSAYSRAIFSSRKASPELLSYKPGQYPLGNNNMTRVLDINIINNSERVKGVIDVKSIIYRE